MINRGKTTKGRVKAISKNNKGEEATTCELIVEKKKLQKLG